MTETPEDTATGPELVDPPEDAADDVAKGYAIYDRTVGQFVGGVTTDKPSRTDVRDGLPEGHTGAVVKV